jgi:hypothetical protein
VKKCQRQGLTPGALTDPWGSDDFAAHTAGHHEGQRYFDLFNNILRYLLTSGARLDAGHTMQVGENEFLRLRKPGPREPFLEGPSEIFVAEIISPEQVRS